MVFKWIKELSDINHVVFSLIYVYCKHYMKLTITYLLLLFSLLGGAQNEGSVFLRVYPKDAIIKLKDSTLKSHETYSLDSGNYVIKMWQTKREYVERTISIKSGKTTQLLEVLSYSDDFKKFRRRRLMYNVNKSLMRYGPPVVLGWYIQSTLSTWSDLDGRVTKFHDLGVAAKNDYDTGVEKDQLQSRKEAYEMYKEAYEKSLIEYNESKKNRLMIGAAVIVSAVAIEYFSFKLKKPVYQEKVLLSSFYINNYNNEWIPSFYLAYKF